MVEVPRDLQRLSLAERHLGLIAAIAGVIGLIAICGSPAAVIGYLSELADVIWAIAGSVFG
jgi:hypothetical protein